MSPSSLRRGMTLTEVMVYCLLLSMFSLMVFVNLPNKGNATTEDLHEAAVLANKALGKLTLEAGNSSATSFTVTTSPAGVIFLSGSSDGYAPFTYTSAGDLAWKGWVGYFFQKGGLLRVWYPLSSGVARSAVGTTPTAATMLAQGKTQMICTRVASFAVSSPEANLWQFDLKIDVDDSETILTSGTGARN